MALSELKTLAKQLRNKNKQNNVEITDIVQALATTIEKIDSLLSVVEKVRDLEAATRGLGAKVADLEDHYDEIMSRIGEIEKKAENDNDRLEAVFREGEFNRAKVSVLIAGVRLHAKAKKSESMVQTAELAQHILDVLKMKSVITATRFKKTNAEKPPLIKVTFPSVTEKANFYKQLAEIKPKSKDEFIKSMNCRDECPPFLMEQYNAAQKRGYEVRKANPGTKVRIIIRKKRIDIMKKDPRAEKFEIIENNAE